MLHWEYWPFHAVYTPLYPYWLWLALKSRSLFFFNASNPTIQYGGFLMESKKDIYDLMPEGSYPLTLLFRQGTDFDVARLQAEAGRFGFPLIAKPDIGLRGTKVVLLRDEDEWRQYHTATRVDYLLQEYVPFENEVGLFYCKLPGREGAITGITGKQLLKVTGDGSSTIEQLLIRNDRFFLQLSTLQKSLGNDVLSGVPLAGETCLLVPFGNHCRGAMFIDITHLCNQRLTDTINRVCGSIEGFYFGRLDIRYNTWEEFCDGVNFKIIELNGAGSEPTHIYDPKHSIWFAWGEIIRHWRLLYQVSSFNKQTGIGHYLTWRQGMKMFKDNKEHMNLLNSN